MNRSVEDIKHSISIDASMTEVWNHISTARSLSEWFMQNNLVAQPGYMFHLQSPFGPSPCTVLSVQPEKELSFSWDTDGWIVTFSLSSFNGLTVFTVTHGGWKNADDLVSKANQPQSNVRNFMSQGWAGMLQKLKAMF
jgi:uncharacterized protein YndB with AHSA1/START domain